MLILPTPSHFKLSKVLFFLLGSLLGYHGNVWAHDEGAVLRAFDKARKSVVGIYSFTQDSHGNSKGEISGLGSGFFFSDQCLIVTNRHVINGAKRVGVSIADEAKGREAEVIASSQRLDIALLKVKGTNRCRPLSPTAEKEIRVGKSVFALGHPIGLEVTMTGGMISALNRSFGHTENIYHRLVQTDVPIFPGNSGGPVIDTSGRVIGVNTFKTKYGTGLSFAVPMTVVQSLIPEFLKYKGLQKRTLGIQAEQHEKNVIRKIDDYVSGIFVKEVFPGTPAHRSGIRPKDLIFKSNGKPLKSINDLEMELYSYPVGEHITLQVARGGKVVQVSIPVTTQ